MVTLAVSTLVVVPQTDRISFAMPVGAHTWPACRCGASLHEVRDEDNSIRRKERCATAAPGWCPHEQVRCVGVPHRRHKSSTSHAAGSGTRSHAICTAVKVLEDLKPAAEKAGCPLSFFKVPKGGDAAPACKEAIQFVQESGGSIAGLAKLKQSGPLCDAFGGVLQSEGVQLTDVALGIGKLLVTHDRQSDLQNSKKAGFLTSSVMNVAVKRIEDNVDKRKVLRLPRICSSPVMAPSQLQCCCTV